MVNVKLTDPSGKVIVDKEVSAAEAGRIAKVAKVEVPTPDPYAPEAYDSRLETMVKLPNWPEVEKASRPSSAVGAWLFGRKTVGNIQSTLDMNFDIAEKAMRVADVLEPLSPKERQRVLHRIGLRHGSSVNPEAVLERYERRGEMEILRELDAWLSQELKFERPHGSVLHRFADAVAEGKLMALTNKGIGRGASNKDFANAQSFVIEHDWAAAFAKATDFHDGDIRLPYNEVAFEFRVSGKPIICLAGAVDPERFVLVIETKHGWCIPGFGHERRESGELRPLPISSEHADSLRKRFWPQIRAVCISLDADVTKADVVEAPHRLNRKKISLGRTPVAAYHVVSLARRDKSTRLVHVDGDREPGYHVGLHWRRGHWRHYGFHDVANEDEHHHAWIGDKATEKHTELGKRPATREFCRCGSWRTWLKWNLVGDPDLGFIDKHYKL